MYKKGDGFQRNPKEAMRWFSKAAEQGNVGAIFNLGFGTACVHAQLNNQRIANACNPKSAWTEAAML